MNSVVSNTPSWPADKPILLFDGFCNLCDGFVQFVLRHDRKEQFCFVSLQSGLGQRILLHYDLSEEDMDSAVLICNNKCYTHSAVALEVGRLLGGRWAVGYVFVLLPRGFRDRLYEWVARNRYRWFGKKKACMMPSPQWKERFLDM